MFWGAAAAPPQRRARKPRDDRGGEPRGKRHAGERDEGRPRIVVLADAGRHDRQRSGPDERPAPAKRGGIMKRLILLAFAASVLTRPATAKDTRFWNLTSSTVKSLELAPAGASAFGPNQCANDPDGAVDHDERVRVTGVTTGAYDARVTLADGRVCMAKGIRIESGQPFAIEDRDLVGCER